MDGNSSLLLLSPYVIADSNKLDDELLLISSVPRLIYPEDRKTDPFWHGRLGKAYLTKRRWALGAFLKLLYPNIGSEIPHLIPNADKANGFDPKTSGTEAIAEAEAKLWLCIYKALEWLDSKHLLQFRPVPFVWVDILNEGNGLVSVYSHTLGEPWHKPDQNKKGNRKSAKALFAKVQRQNQMLWTLSTNDNDQLVVPLDAETSPHNYKFVQDCYPLAIKYPEFKKEIWNELVKARMHLTQVAMKNAHIIRPNGRIDNRGRKPSNRRKSSAVKQKRNNTKS